MNDPLNLPKLAKVFAWVLEQDAKNNMVREKYPDAKDGEHYLVWDQDVWRRVIIDDGETCGTAMCFAGYTAQVFKARFLDAYGMPEWVEADSDIDWPAGTMHVLDDGTKAVSIETYATKRLGLTPLESGELFTSGNTASEIEEAINEIVANRGVAEQWQALTFPVVAG